MTEATGAPGSLVLAPRVDARSTGESRDPASDAPRPAAPRTEPKAGRARARWARPVGLVVFLAIGIASADRALAQGLSASSRAFGGRDRAEAASQIITLAVQQAISSLPPASAQTAAYTYDPKTDAYAVSRKPGPVAFRTPETIGDGKIGIRLATSYFDLNETFGPASYVVHDPRGQSRDLYTSFGLQAEAHAGVFIIAAEYGVTQSIQLNFTLPVTVVDASAKQTFPTFPDSVRLPPGKADVVAANVPAIRELVRRGDLAERTESIDTADERFQSGTAAGVGRISLGVKSFLGSFAGIEGALESEFFCPSPSEAEFAGSASPSLLGRAIAGYRFSTVQALVDAGYDYDFDVSELRRFVWNAGLSTQLTSVSFDLGFGGSIYNEGIRWTPAVASGPVSALFPDGSVLQAEKGNRLGTNLVQFLGGFKVRIAAGMMLSGTVVVPVTADGAQPAAIGSAAIETYF